MLKMPRRCHWLMLLVALEQSMWSQCAPAQPARPAPREPPVPADLPDDTLAALPAPPPPEIDLEAVLRGLKLKTNYPGPISRIYTRLWGSYAAIKFKINRAIYKIRRFFTRAPYKPKTTTAAAPPAAADRR